MLRAQQPRQEYAFTLCMEKTKRRVEVSSQARLEVRVQGEPSWGDAELENIPLWIEVDGERVLEALRRDRGNDFTAELELESDGPWDDKKKGRLCAETRSLTVGFDDTRLDWPAELLSADLELQFNCSITASTGTCAPEVTILEL